MQQQHQHTINLVGSASLVTEFFLYSVNSILYQRGLYPPESFVQRKKYGSPVLLSTDDQLCEYLQVIMNQVKCWMLERTLRKLVLVISDTITDEVIERWQFDVSLDSSAIGSDGQSEVKTDKSDAEIHREMAVILRQVVASVTLLPILDNPCSFELLIYTDREAVMPEKWLETGPSFINNASTVKLRSFSTKIHQVDTCVTYKLDD